MVELHLVNCCRVKVSGTYCLLTALEQSVANRSNTGSQLWWAELISLVWSPHSSDGGQQSQ